VGATFRGDSFDGRERKCAQTVKAQESDAEERKQLDGWAAMLQAISIGRGIPMLEPWIIDEIRRREEERWPNEGNGDAPRREQGDKPPERGVVIIGM
jgi:hypothetical protein